MERNIITGGKYEKDDYASIGVGSYRSLGFWRRFPGGTALHEWGKLLQR
jgi:hypothetical protein